MFVQEEKIFAGKVLRLHVCAFDGAEWLEEATEDTSVEKLKERCLKHVRPATAPGFPLSPAAHWTVGLRTGRFILYLLVQLPSRQPGGPGRIGDAGWERPSRRRNGASCDSRIHPSALAVAARFPELGVSAHEGRERPAGRSAFP